MSSVDDIPGKYQRVYTINTTNLMEFERVKIALVNQSEVEDVLYDDQHSPPEITLLTNATISDSEVQRLVSQLGFQLIPKNLRIT